ncbi:unnamed protein product [Pedinophyceae sp. YPF-701]|nr:unnamed protein product [Pedinophyceae sp. YPF-701]
MRDRDPSAGHFDDLLADNAARAGQNEDLDAMLSRDQPNHERFSARKRDNMARARGYDDTPARGRPPARASGASEQHAGSSLPETQTLKEMMGVLDNFMVSTSTGRPIKNIPPEARERIVAAVENLVGERSHITELKQCREHFDVYSMEVKRRTHVVREVVSNLRTTFKAAESVDINVKTVAKGVVMSWAWETVMEEKFRTRGAHPAGPAGRSQRGEDAGGPRTMGQMSTGLPSLASNDAYDTPKLEFRQPAARMEPLLRSSAGQIPKTKRETRGASNGGPAAHKRSGRVLASMRGGGAMHPVPKNAVNLPARNQLTLRQTTAVERWKWEFICRTCCYSTPFQDIDMMMVRSSCTGRPVTPSMYQNLYWYAENKLEAAAGAPQLDMVEINGQTWTLPHCKRCASSIQELAEAKEHDSDEANRVRVDVEEVPAELRAQYTVAADRQHNREVPQLPTPQPARPRTRQAKQARLTYESQVVQVDDDDEGEDAVALAPQRPRRSCVSPPRPKVPEFRVLLEGIEAKYPPDAQRGSLMLTGKDLDHLAPGEFLNDTVIEFSYRFLHHELLAPAQRDALHIFSTFFLTTLRKANGPALERLHRPKAGTPGFGSEEWVDAFETAYARVRNWTKHVDVFSKKFLFIPCHNELHWSLIIVCFPSHFQVRRASQQDAEPVPAPGADSDAPADPGGQPLTLLHLDSIRNTRITNNLTKYVQGYLHFEWQKTAGIPGTYAHAWTQRHGQGADGLVPNFLDVDGYKMKQCLCPQQENGYDCGLFMLANMAMFSLTDPDVVKYEGNTSSKRHRSRDWADYTQFLTMDWYKHDVAADLRVLLFYNVADKLDAVAAEAFAPDSKERAALEKGKAVMAQQIRTDERRAKLLLAAEAGGEE